MNHSTSDDTALRNALLLQHDEHAHDRGLILERLAWTPEQRLEANASFLRFYFSRLRHDVRMVQRQHVPRA